ncbi:MAG: hypothetical protein PHD83_01275 [Caldisericia bacterium]|nr:hypothetical protein [Caldisericia bacterium]
MEWLVTLQIPKQDVWFVQHTIESFDGIALMTTGKMQESVGWFDIYLHNSTYPDFEALIHFLQQEMPLLQIIWKEGLDGI